MKWKRRPVTTAGTDHIPLRVLLKEMSDDLNQAVDIHLAHLKRCGCRGHCKAARALGEQVADAQYRLGVTRFLNEGG